MRHQYESMRVEFIDKRWKGFEEVGKKETYDPISHMVDLTCAKEVSEYMVFKEENKVCVGSCQNTLSIFQK